MSYFLGLSERLECCKEGSSHDIRSSRHMGTIRPDAVKVIYVKRVAEVKRKKSKRVICKKIFQNISSDSRKSAFVIVKQFSIATARK